MKRQIYKVTITKEALKDAFSDEKKLDTLINEIAETLKSKMIFNAILEDVYNEKN